MGCVNHSSVGRLVWSFQESEGKWRKYIYMMLVVVKGADFWRGDEVKFLVFMIMRRCGIDWELDCNQLRLEVDMDLFLS
jgi:hypothetical protein